MELSQCILDLNCDLYNNLYNYFFKFIFFIYEIRETISLFELPSIHFLLIISFILVLYNHFHYTFLYNNQKIAVALNYLKCIIIA